MANSSKEAKEWIGNCLFCAKSLPITLKRCKLFASPCTEFSPVGGTRTHFREGDCPAIDPHLKIYFIVRRLLNIRVKVLQELLASTQGDSKFEAWVKVCLTCGQAVHSFYKNFMQISKLERKIKKASCESKIKNHIVKKNLQNDKINNKLIQNILATMNNKGTCPIWSRLRMEASKAKHASEPIQASHVEERNTGVKLNPIPEMEPTKASCDTGYANYKVPERRRKQVILPRIVTETELKIK